MKPICQKVSKLFSGAGVFRSLLLLLTCLFTSTTLKAELLDPDAHPAIAIGVGYDLIKRQVRGDCVVVSSLQSPAAVGENVTFFLNEIENLEVLRTNLSLSASASFAAEEFGLRGKTSLLNVVNINRYSLFLLASVRVEQTPVRMRDVVLTASASALYESGVENFRTRCGDEFVVGSINGGEYHAVIQIKTQNREERRAISKDLSGSYGVFSGSGKFSRALQRIAQENQVQVFVYRSGGVGRVIAIDPDGLINEATSFPATVQGTNARRIAAIAQSYETLPLPGTENPIDINNQKSVLGELFSVESRYKSVLSDLEYIASNQREFDDPNIEELNAAISELRIGLNTVRSSARECFADYRDCTLPSIIFPSISYPERYENELQGCENPIYIERVDPLCGPATFRLGRAEVCGVDSYKPGAGPACGPELFKVGRAVECGVEAYRTSRSVNCGEEFFEDIEVRRALIRSNQGSYIWDATCKDFGYLGQGSVSWATGSCRRYAACRHSSHDVESYVSCRHASNGVERYKTCRDVSFGVAQFKECRDESFGVEAYATCRREEFGFDRCGD